MIRCESKQKLKRHKRDTEKMIPSDLIAVDEFRRVKVPGDNSCLFTAVREALQQKISAETLRLTVAKTIAMNRDIFPDYFFDRPRAQYVEWIRDSRNWGGATETLIMAKIFCVQIAVVQVNTGCGCGKSCCGDCEDGE